MAASSLDYSSQWRDAEGTFEHVRYPEDMFLIQSEMFTIYHMQDPQVFYNKEDKWNIPNELIDNKQASMSPYYIIMRLPGESEPEYIQMLPFTPIANRI